MEMKEEEDKNEMKTGKKKNINKLITDQKIQKKQAKKLKKNHLKKLKKNYLKKLKKNQVKKLKKNYQIN